jgi:ferrochelatase
MIITSFHGVPKRYLLEGDPYHCYSAKTSRLLKESLQWPAEKWLLTFQSRFGTEEWLQPYTDKAVEALAENGRAKNIVVIAPGFVADCLETLEELNVELREDFMAHGGENFSYIPCLNDSEFGIDVIESVVRRELQGWI